MLSAPKKLQGSIAHTARLTNWEKPSSDPNTPRCPAPFCKLLESKIAPSAAVNSIKDRDPDTKIDPAEQGTIDWLRKEGRTLQRITDRFGVNRQSIHQILKRGGEDSTQ